MAKTNLTVEQCEEILENQEIGFLSMSREGQPYCIPVNFLYDRGRIYIHTGHKGIKWDYLMENPRVCFTVAVPGKKVTGESPCQYTYEFESIVIFGSAVRVATVSEVKESLLKLIDKYRVAPVTPVPEEKLEKVQMIKIGIERISGRKNEM